MSFAAHDLKEVTEIPKALDVSKLNQMAKALAASRERSGRVSILDAGGGASHAGHVVNDFHKIGESSPSCLL
jgi:hypothetical protein